MVIWDVRGKEEIIVDEKLLEILACPACDERPPVRLENEEILCDKCGRAYPVRNGIPVMLVDEARMTREVSQ